MATYVIAIGGNALEQNKESLDLVYAKIASCIAEIIRKGSRVVIVHGNGSQIGDLIIQNEYAENVVPKKRIDECGAMTQALIGYELQQAIGNELVKTGLKRDVITVLTQVVVDPDDPAMRHPVKPVGPFYNQEEAEVFIKESNITMAEDAGRGYRRVLPSPAPREIKEIEAIKYLLDQKEIVIAGGGGGIPVAYGPDKQLHGVEAVIDKDLTAEKIAEEIHADYLLILTGVEYVAIHYAKPEQQSLKYVSVEQLQNYIDQNQFAGGSMLPKIKACMNFVESNHSGKAYIGALNRIDAVVKEESGTCIVA